MTDPRVHPPRSGGKSPWLPFGACEDAAVRLLCLPHAGAGATVYRTWASDLPAFVGACPVQPPGRERRRNEQPIYSAETIAATLAPEIMSAVNWPYAVLGHSTGAICAFELIREIRRLGGPAPVHLFVGGRRAPHLPMTRTDLTNLPIPELATVLSELGGTPAEVLASEDVLRMIQPLLAADFAVNEGYVYRDEPPLAVPITAFAGVDDRGASVAQIAQWSQHTAAGFNVHELAGGHFAIFQAESGVLAVIAESLRPWT